MRNLFPCSFFVGIALLLPGVVTAQTVKPLNACDLNSDGVVNLLDIQLAVNMALGQAGCTATVVKSGSCDVVLVQRVTNAALTGNCITGATAHTVTLSWTASTSSNIAGYNVYRSSTAGGPYTKINSTAVSGTTFTDPYAQSGATYYYVTTAVDTSNNESAYSNQAQAVIPVP